MGLTVFTGLIDCEFSRSYSKHNQSRNLASSKHLRLLISIKPKVSRFVTFNDLMLCQLISVHMLYIQSVSGHLALNHGIMRQKKSHVSTSWQSTDSGVKWGIQILHLAEEHNLSPIHLNIACLCQIIKINNNKHVYRQSQVQKSTDSGVKWAECSLIIGTGC